MLIWGIRLRSCGVGWEKDGRNGRGWREGRGSGSQGVEFSRAEIASPPEADEADKFSNWTGVVGGSGIERVVCMD